MQVKTKVYLTTENMAGILGREMILVWHLGMKVRVYQKVLAVYSTEGCGQT